MNRSRIRRIGNSLGAILPAEVLEKCNLAEGDEVYVASDADGIHISPYAPDFDHAMEVFEEGCRKYRNALRKLAE